MSTNHAVNFNAIDQVAGLSMSELRSRISFLRFRKHLVETAITELTKRYPAYEEAGAPPVHAQAAANVAQVAAAAN